MKKLLFLFLVLFFISGCFLNKTTDSTVVCDGRRVSISEGCIPDDGLNYFEEQIECVPATCCHPTECTLNAPDCKGTICTMECKPETLDCGQGHCEYINGKCEAILNG